MRAHGPGEEALARADEVADELSVAVPELLTAPKPPPRPAREPVERHAERQVKPDERVGLREHEVAELAAVVAVEHPAVRSRGDRSLDTRAKLVRRRLRPVRSVVQSVELDVR